MISGAALSPTVAASRSACRPAQMTSRDSRKEPAGVSASTPSAPPAPRSRSAVTGVEVSTRPPAAVTSAANERAMAG